MQNDSAATETSGLLAWKSCQTTQILKSRYARLLVSMLICKSLPFLRRPNMSLMSMKLIASIVKQLWRSWQASPNNRRVMIQGYHGTGKSTHIEQVAAHLNWPCVRVNLDSHISRIDLIGKDAIVLREGKQVTEYREGMLPWALQNPVALVFDEYDAGRPDVMFVIQRILETEGRLTLLDQNKVIRPHPSFRLFSTANTVGPWGHQWPLSWNPANQSGTAGSLEHCGPAELPRSRC